MTVKYQYTFADGKQEAKTIKNVKLIEDNGSFLKVVYDDNGVNSTIYFEKKKINYFDVEFN